jgi:hypothetical protein
LFDPIKKGGRYEPSTGSSLCSSCSGGHYSTTTGSSSQTACIECSAGQHQTLEASQACDTCLAGTYQANTGKKIIRKKRTCRTHTHLFQGPDSYCHFFCCCCWHYFTRTLPGRLVRVRRVKQASTKIRAAPVPAVAASRGNTPLPLVLLRASRARAVPSEGTAQTRAPRRAQRVKLASTRTTRANPAGAKAVPRGDLKPTQARASAACALLVSSRRPLATLLGVPPAARASLNPTKGLLRVKTAQQGKRRRSRASRRRLRFRDV